jgi:predicted TIM-barrel fold metal-dependent hydrolase
VPFKGHLVVDCDAHYLEPVAELAEYMDEPWRSRIANAGPGRWILAGVGDLNLEGRIRRDDADYSAQTLDYDGLGQGVEKAALLRDVMTRIGIDAAILLPNRMTHLGRVSKRDFPVQLSKGFARYMVDRVCDPAQGLYTMVIACWQDPRASAELIHEVAGHPAIVGVAMMTGGANPPLGAPVYDPIYQAAQDHGLPIVMHSTPGLNLVEGADYASFQSLIESHSLGFLVSNQIQLTSMLLEGIPERFPKLNFVFEESGLFWVPMMQFRLDEYFLKRRSEAPLLQRLPSEYIRERFYFGTQPIEAPPDPRYFEAVFEAANGFDHFVYCSDYPHFDYDDPISITKLAFLSDEQKAKVLGLNALDVFDFRKAGVQPWENIASQPSTTSLQTAASS